MAVGSEKTMEQVLPVYMLAVIGGVVLVMVVLIAAAIYRARFGSGKSDHGFR